MDIIVIGAGVSGLTAADLLSKAGTVNQNKKSNLLTVKNKQEFQLSTLLLR